VAVAVIKEAMRDEKTTKISKDMLEGVSSQVDVSSVVIINAVYLTRIYI
jgi:hypothetical protein